ncbi:hypothetical protein F5887DRAFT_1021078, partial [Amanita rubescens]
MRFSHIALFALPALAAASAIMPRNGNGHGGGGGGGGQSCSTGSNECCNQTFTATQITPTLAIILALIGVNVGDITALVGGKYIKYDFLNLNL